MENEITASKGVRILTSMRKVTFEIDREWVRTILEEFDKYQDISVEDFMAWSEVWNAR